MAWHIIYKSRNTASKTYTYLGSEFDKFNNNLVNEGFEVIHIQPTPDQIAKLRTGQYNVILPSNGTVRVVKKKD